MNAKLKVLFSAAALASIVSVAMPSGAFADDWGRGPGWEHGHHRHEGWRRRYSYGYGYGPPAVVYAPPAAVYAAPPVVYVPPPPPPPVVYAPPVAPSINLVLPLNFR